MKGPLLVLLAALASLALVIALRVPFVWLSLAWVPLAAALVAVSRGGLRPVACVISVTALLSLGLEALVHFVPSLGQAHRFEGNYDGFDPWQDDELLGYRPTADLAIHSRKSIDGTTIYDVTYTYDDHALRHDPGFPCEEAERSALFFGGSFLLGEGLDDDETLPSHFARLAGGRCQVANFGYHGYGPHQMLANLESDRVARAADHDVTLGVYLAIPDHVVRITGRKTWDLYGPWYVVHEGGRVERAGSFQDQPPPSPARLRDFVFWCLRFSAAGTKFLRRPGGPRPGEVDAYGAVVEASRDALVRAHPGARFVTLLWDDSHTADAIVAALERRGLEVHRATEVLGSPLHTWLIQRDTHPRSDAFERLAEFLTAL